MISFVLEYRIPTPDDLGAILTRDEQAFVGAPTDEEREAWRTMLALERFRTVWDGAALVGVAGSHALQFTLPGGTQVAMGGTTWVSVAPTHRRQGLLRRLMTEVHDDIIERGEPIAGLQASEGSIYARFGYGIATRRRIARIDRRRFQIAETFRPEPGAVRLIDPLEEIDRLADLYGRYQRSTVGEVSRTAAWIDMRLRSEKSRVWGALHEDGFVLWTVKENWNNWDARHELSVLDLVACRPAAHVALWHLLLTHDLVGPIDAAIALDDPLPYLLTNQRGLRTVTMNDFLWLCPLDLKALAGARRYRVDGSVTVDVDGERVRIEGGADGADAAPTNDAPDVTMTRGAFGSLIAGGVTASELAAGGLLEGAQLGRADAFFGWSPTADCSTSF